MKLLCFPNFPASRISVIFSLFLRICRITKLSYFLYLYKYTKCKSCKKLVYFRYHKKDLAFRYFIICLRGKFLYLFRIANWSRSRRLINISVCYLIRETTHFINFGRRDGFKAETFDWLNRRPANSSLIERGARNLRINGQITSFELNYLKTRFRRREII